MSEVIYQLSYLLPYLIIFPVLSIILMLVLWFLSKRKITNKNVSFYGLFMNLKFMDVLALSCLVIYYFIIIESFFVTSYYTIYSVVFFMLPIIAFNVVSFNGNIFKTAFSLGNALLLLTMLFFKNIFYTYIIDYNNSGYMIVLLVMLCVFVFLYATYVFLNSLLNVLRRNKYVKVREGRG